MSNIIDKRFNFIGLSIDLIQSKEQLVSFILFIVKNGRNVVFYGHSLWSISVLKQYPNVWHYAEQADLLVSDGRPFFLLAKWHGLPLKYELSIPNLVFLCLELASQNKWSVILFGAEPLVNKKAVHNLKAKYSGISKVEGYDGYCNEDELNYIRQRIKVFAPDIVLIGLPSPTKERLAIEWRGKLNAKIIIPCGGMIDVLGGKTKVTPVLIKKLGLATLYRLFQEPKRLLLKTVRIYAFVMLYFLPLYLFKYRILRKKDFSIIDHFKIKTGVQ